MQADASRTGPTAQSGMPGALPCRGRLREPIAANARLVFRSTCATTLSTACAPGVAGVHQDIRTTLKQASACSQNV